MGIELRLTDRGPNVFDIFDEHGIIGSLWYSVACEDDQEEGWEDGWVTAMYRGIEGGEWVTTPQPTVSKAVDQAWGLYELLLEERRRLARFYRNCGWSIVSVPMGGQPRRW